MDGNDSVRSRPFVHSSPGAKASEWPNGVRPFESGLPMPKNPDFGANGRMDGQDVENKKEEFDIGYEYSEDE